MITPLDFLPPGGLASSVITTVWVGVMVVVFFNLRFGTTLSGLVVPGYLIPLFIVHPVSGYVILAESVLTYIIARVIADRALVKLGLGEMFGRDRFFFLILISVLVRIVSDGFILPPLAEQLAQWGAPYSVRSGLHSFGLIIIALCANQFWNGGLRVGGITLGIYLVVTYAIVVYILMPFTNFNISTLSYMYEDIASSILASPKAYIILITAAYVASRMNLRYGWDFNGILIPSLLALQWYDPFKILTTFVEAIVIFFGAQLVMAMPVIRNMNMEGARQLLLFFNVGFFYKLLLGYAIIYFAPEFKVTDFYGFGYVLGTLMALKMYQKGIMIRFARTTLQTSLIAIVIASVLGFSMTFFSNTNPQAWQSFVGESKLQLSEQSLSQFVANTRSLTYQSEGESGKAESSLNFTSLFKQAATIGKDASRQQFDALAQESQLLGYTTTLISQRYIALHDTDPALGRGFYIIDTHATGSLAIEVPKALDEPKAAAVAERIFTHLSARYLAYTGARADRADDGSDNVLLNGQSVFQRFHQAVANNSALQLRSYTRSAARQLLGLRPDQQALDLDISATSVRVKRSLPQDLPLQPLKTLLGGFEISWQTPRAQNRQRDTAIKGFVEVYLNDQSLLSVYRHSAQKQAFTQVALQQRIDGYLQSFLSENKLTFAARNSNDYKKADKYELLYFDQAVLQPALDLIDEVAQGPWLAAHQSRLNQLSKGAGQFGYQVLLYRHIPSDRQYIIFKQDPAVADKRHWGTYVLTLGKAQAFIVEVPMPLYEQNTFEFGTELFESLNARAILITGTHPLANQDGSSQLTSTYNLDSLFNLFHQSLLTHYQHDAPFAVQVRGFSPAEQQQSNKIVVAHFEYQKPGAQKHPRLLALKQQLADSGLQQLQADKDRVDQRFVAKHNAQSRYTKYIGAAQYAEVWLPSALRYQFKRNSDNNLLSKKLTALALPTRKTDVKQWLLQQPFGVLEQSQVTQFKSMLQQFEYSQNITGLMALYQSKKGWQLLQDNNSQQYFMALSDDNEQLVFVANLMPLNQQEQYISATQAEQITTFFDNRQHYLIGGVMP